MALQIRLLYTSDWFSSAKIKDFSDAAAEYIQIFLQFYSDDSSDLKKTAPGGVKVQEKKRGEKQKKDNGQNPMRMILYHPLKQEI